jgi:hypothetical protein
MAPSMAIAFAAAHCPEIHGGMAMTPDAPVVSTSTTQHAGGSMR